MTTPANCPRYVDDGGPKCARCGGYPDEHTDAAVIHHEVAPEPLRTKSGRVLTDADLSALADEAEAGYDVEPLLQQRRDRERGWNEGVEFTPQRADDERPVMRLADCLVFAYVRDGVLHVSVDLEEADAELLLGVTQEVPMEVTVGGDIVWASRPGLRSAGLRWGESNRRQR